MLLELSIKDFAIIDALHLRLHRLFNVFTGETGAGKSIIIDAVNTLLGGKIGAEIVRSGCERATVEGVFSIEKLPPVTGEWLILETSAVGTTAAEAANNGARTMFEAFDNAEAQSEQRERGCSACNAAARVRYRARGWAPDPDARYFPLGSHGGAYQWAHGNAANAAPGGKLAGRHSRPERAS